MNPNEKRDKLAQLRFGPYVTPVVAAGVVVECEARGLVTVVGVADSPIPWPLGERDGEVELIVFKALARALRQEEPSAVAAAWGVPLETAEKWRATCRQPRRRKKQTRSSPPIPWKREDDELISRLSLAEVARLTGRTITAVRKRRRALGLPDGRMREHRSVRTQDSIPALAVAAQIVLRERRRALSKSMAELRATRHQSIATVSFWQSQAAAWPYHCVDRDGKTADGARAASADNVNVTTTAEG